MHFISLVDVSNIWTNCIFHWKLPLVIITIHMETCCSVFGMITCWLCTWAEFTLIKEHSWAWQCPAKVQAAQCVMVTQHRWWCWLRVKFSLSTYSSQCSMCSLESSEVCGMIYITVWQCFWRWRTGNGGLECVNSRLVAASVQMILPCSQLWVCVHHLLEDVCESVPAITLKKKEYFKKALIRATNEIFQTCTYWFLFSLWFTHGMHQWIYTLSTIAHCPWHSLGWYPLAFRQTKTLENLKNWGRPHSKHFIFHQVWGSKVIPWHNATLHNAVSGHGDNHIKVNFTFLLMTAHYTARK